MPAILNVRWNRKHLEYPFSIYFELEIIVMADCREIKKEIHRTIRAFLLCTLTMSGFIIGLAKISYAGFLIFKMSHETCPFLFKPYLVHIISLTSVWKPILDLFNPGWFYIGNPWTEFGHLSAAGLSQTVWPCRPKDFSPVDTFKVISYFNFWFITYNHKLWIITV